MDYTKSIKTHPVRRWATGLQACPCPGISYPQLQSLRGVPAPACVTHGPIKVSIPTSTWTVSCSECASPDPSSCRCPSKIFLSSSTGHIWVQLTFWSGMGFPALDNTCFRASWKQLWPSQSSPWSPHTGHHCLPLQLKSITYAHLYLYAK